MSNLIIIKNHYNTENDVKRLLDYALRETQSWHKMKCLYAGGSGVNTYDTRSMLNSFLFIRKMYRKNGGTLVDHFVINNTERKHFDSCITLIAMEISNFLIGEGYQNMFFIHTNEKGIPHIHFIFNHISYLNGLKFHNTQIFYNQLLNILKENYKFLNWQDDVIYNQR